MSTDFWNWSQVHQSVNHIFKIYKILDICILIIERKAFPWIYYKAHQVISQVWRQILIGSHRHGSPLLCFEVLTDPEVNHTSLPLRGYRVRIPTHKQNYYIKLNFYLGSIWSMTACASSGDGGFPGPRDLWGCVGDTPRERDLSLTSSPLLLSRPLSALPLSLLLESLPG